MTKSLSGWLLFILIALIWGSSFILMKIGLNNGLSPVNIAAFRIFSAGLVLLPIAIKSFGKIPLKLIPYCFLSGVLGSLFPAFLFCIAEQGIDSSLAGMLNSLTPIFVIITGAIFFNKKTSINKIAGILIAFIGSILLIVSKGNLQLKGQAVYALMIVAATIMYGLNVNVVAKYLSGYPSLQIASVALTLIAIPALLVLVFTGFLMLPFTNEAVIKGVSASFVLGVGGTAIATILFYVLLKKTGAIFASMVTYAIPIVSVLWGVYFNELFNWKQAICLLIILAGVFIVNKKNS